MTCKYCGQPSPKEYYDIAMSMTDGEHKIFTIFGRTPAQLLEALNFYDKRKSQMTREEAHKKLNDLNYDTKEGIDYDLKVVEALGLIKFDEPKINKDLFRHGITLDNIKSLEHAGYKIIKQNSNVSVELTQHHAPHVPFRFRGKLKDIKQED